MNKKTQIAGSDASLNASSKSRAVTRRAVLRGLGASVALPFMPSLHASPRAAEIAMAAALPGLPASHTPPTRLACLFFPNGVDVKNWKAQGSGKNMQLSKTLAPLNDFKENMTVFEGLAHENAKKGDGHYVKTASWLSGEVVRKTRGEDIRAGVSMDQIIAKTVGANDPIQSLVLGVEPTKSRVDTNVGFTTLYGGHVSWSSPVMPSPKEVFPRQAFDRLFSVSLNQRANASILDAVLRDANALRGRIAAKDRQTLDDYLESVREVERRVEAASANAKTTKSGAPVYPKGVKPPEEGLPQDKVDHMNLMMDLMILAFQTNKTRVATFMFGNAVSNMNMNFLDGVKGGHHSISHHGNNQQQVDMYQKINTFHVEMFARMLKRMSDVEEGDGTLLDHSMILYGSGLSDGNRHQSNNLPIILAGGEKIGLNQGRVVSAPKGTPLCALHLALMQQMGVDAKQFGDADRAIGL